MKMTFFNKLFISATLILLTFGLSAQDQLIADRVIANVGDKIILQSDIENQVIQLKAQGYQGRGDIKCEVFEEMLVQKLLLIQAELDSIEIGMNQVEGEL